MTHAFLTGLDVAQMEAATSTSGIVRVRAGAGTGKTRVLTTRCVYLSRVLGVDPKRILGTTFTVKASREMRERVLGLGGSELSGVTLATVHSLAARLLRRHWQAAGLQSRDFLISDADESRSLMAAAVDASGVLGQLSDDADGKKIRKDYIDSCLSKISRWKENGVSARMISAERPQRHFSDEDFCTVYLLYERSMAERNLLDFSDLTLKAVELMEGSPEILREESDKIEYIMVDEFQDTNLIQLRFLALLASGSGNLMVVGDDDQSIYSFRGAISRLMDRLDMLLPDLVAGGLKDVALITNRRCTEQVLGHANLLVDYNRRDTPKILQSGRNGVPVQVKAYPTCKAEGAGVVKDIKALLDAGTASDQIAVLARTGYVLTPIGAALVEARVPHQMQAGTGLLERSEVRDILAYLKLAVNPSLDVAFERIAARPIRGLGASAVELILATARARSIPIHEALAIISDSKSLKAPGQKGAVELGQKLSVLADAALRQESSEDMVRYVTQQIGYMEWAYQQKDAPKTLRSSLEILSDIARAQPDFLDFLNDMCLLSDPEERAVEGVHVGTFHGCKGLEWDHVFLVGFEDGVIPNARALREADEAQGDQDDCWNTSSAGGIEEERRLAHVGMTRAKISASISFAAVRGTGPMRKEARPSRFLREAELPIPRIAAGNNNTGMVVARGKQKSFF